MHYRLEPRTYRNGHGKSRLSPDINSLVLSRETNTVATESVHLQSDALFSISNLRSLDPISKGKYVYRAASSKSSPGGMSPNMLQMCMSCYTLALHPSLGAFHHSKECFGHCCPSDDSARMCLLFLIEDSGVVPAGGVPHQPHLLTLVSHPN